MAAYCESLALSAPLPPVAPAGPVFGRVTEGAQRVAIVANGPSLGHIALSRFAEAAESGVTVIAVNRILPHLPVAHVWFTLDPDKRNRPIMEERRAGIAYYAAVPDSFGTPAARHPSHRKPAPDGVTLLRRRRSAGLSDDPGAIHSGNSAYGALGLAWLMGAARIALFGVDGFGRHYAHGGGSPRRLEHLPRLFAGASAQLAARGVEVVNGSPRSAVECFEKKSPRDALEWLEG